MGLLRKGRWFGWAVLTAAVALGMAPNASAQTWGIQPLPPVNVATLVAVSCPSTTACMAVGSHYGGPLTQTQLPLAEHWDGQSWIVESPVMPRGANSAVLTGVSCVSGMDCVAVGTTTYEFPVGGGMVTDQDVTLAEHWDGLAWTIMPTPNTNGIGIGHPSRQFLGVSCASRTACTAVGYTDRPNSQLSPYILTLAERWDGTRWTIQPTPTPGPVAGRSITNGSTLYAVSCPSVRICMAGGETESYGSLSEYWRRGKWSIEKTDDPPNSSPGFLYGMACTSPTVCIGVGLSTNDVDEAMSPLAERWDGTRWSRMSIVVPPGRPPWTYKPFLGVSCVSSTACVAVGTVNTADGYQSNLIELLTGKDWMIQTAPFPVGATSARLAGVSCSGTFCSAVGTYMTQESVFAQAMTSTVVSTPVVSTPAGVRITGLRATPLRHGCATETGTSERELNAVIADATCRHFRLTVNGIIEGGGKLLHTGRGTVTASIQVRLPGGPVHTAARAVAAGGRWRFSLVVPGVNLDPVPPSYLIVVHYGGGNSGAPAAVGRRIRIESEPASP